MAAAPPCFKVRAIMKSVTVTFSLLFTLVCFALPARAADSGSNPPDAQASAIPVWTDAGFRVPQPGVVLQVPDALASFPDYRIEWWYLTGHLFSGQRRFGFQATFFRYGLRSPLEPSLPHSSSAFGHEHLHMTHMALVDITGDRFFFQQRLHRNGWDAFADTTQMHVQHGSWQLYGNDPQLDSFRLHASVDADVQWQLDFAAIKPAVQFGPDGTSRKGSAPTARSYYLTFTRLATTGTVTIGKEVFHVTGSSWMDHEKASSQLDPGYQGWDWIAIQLDDGWEVKAYLLRDANNQPSPFSALIWIDPENRVTYFGVDDFEWRMNAGWRSPHTGALYPHAPTIHTRHPVDGSPVSLRFHPLRDDQELHLPGTTYWEGAGDIYGADNRRVGTAYLELVGYAGPIEGLR